MTVPPVASWNPAASAGGLAEVAAELDAPHLAMRGGETRDHLPRAIRAAIVDEHHLHAQMIGRGHRGDLGIKCRQAVALVQDRNDERDEFGIGTERRDGWFEHDSALGRG